ncbi:Rrf2 family transcriptional regulator [Acidithiobacillus marinus]|uniref:Rrf2 family transcriptional regulator n=1 Tax=Acidithiobacillus marinus TaxID=187490 RepID=A0A2I1DP18_9PROT|nr:Rrf2 family transcriptional regulator [Acidithiobacillus marinus]PKY11603.1 Rrf2 family transcriptional regulator [Acidithiobacillus marinus]
MVLGKATEQALRGLIYIAAQPRGEPVLSREIADYLGVPVQCITKLMRNLAKRGFLESVKGRGGGFVLLPAAETLNIIDVAEAVEGHPLSPHCVLGLKVCADETACPLHRQWSVLRRQEIDWLRTQTICEMAKMCFSGMQVA